MGLIAQPPGRIMKGNILFKGKDLLKKTEKEMQKIRGNEISMIFQEPMTALNQFITLDNKSQKLFFYMKNFQKSPKRRHLTSGRKERLKN